MEYFNLDDVIQDDKEIKLGGKVFKVPAEVTMDKMLRILKTGQDLQKNPADPEANEKAIRSLFDVFLIRHPDLNFDEFQSMVTVRQYAKLMEIVFKQSESQKKTEDVQETEEEK